MPISASPRAARRPAMPPPMTTALGTVSTTIGSSGTVSRVRPTPALTSLVGLGGRARVVVGVGPGALLADVHLGVLVGAETRPLGHLPEGEGVQLRRAGGHDDAVEVLLLDVFDDLLLGGVGAGEHGGLGHHHVRVGLQLGDHLVDVDVVGDVAAAVADVDADASLAHLRHLRDCARLAARRRRLGPPAALLLEVGGRLRGRGARVQDRVGDVLDPRRRAGHEHAGDVGGAGIQVLVRLAHLGELVQLELAVGEQVAQLRRWAARPPPAPPCRARSRSGCRSRCPRS